jgi:ribosomal protein L11 methyltransferase
MKRITKVLSKKSTISEKTEKEFIEIEIKVPHRINDFVSNFLIELGSNGVCSKESQEGVILFGYISEQSQAKVVKQSILQYLDELKNLGFKTDKTEVRFKKIEQKDWLKDWKKSFEPIFVSEDIVIIPSWSRTSYPGKCVIRIKPGMAFGTGAHPTTLLCMRAIKKILKPKDRVLDVGCGSGILSILSAKLGASFVLGLDIDQDAIENACENLALNQIEDSIEIKQGTVSADIPNKSFDLAVANLNKREIFESYDNIKVQVKKGGLLIFAGILHEEENEVEDFFRKKGLNVVEINFRDDWVCFVGKS